MTTFTFGGVGITSVAPAGSVIAVSRIQRPIRPVYTKRKLRIPGRDGSWDFGTGDKLDYTITVEIGIAATSSALAAQAETAVATFLDGKEALVFSDAPSTTHTAQAYEMVSAERIGAAYGRLITITFECDA